ncbi:hypothetical protein MTP02_04600 [Streptomyces albus]|nr:hypothetical protein MTP02_04600 [Streptomyces albus]
MGASSAVYAPSGFGAPEGAGVPKGSSPEAVLCSSVVPPTSLSPRRAAPTAPTTGAKSARPHTSRGKRGDTHAGPDKRHPRRWERYGRPGAARENHSNR